MRAPVFVRHQIDCTSFIRNVIELRSDCLFYSSFCVVFDVPRSGNTERTTHGCKVDERKNKRMNFRWDIARSLIWNRVEFDKLLQRFFRSKQYFRLFLPVSFRHLSLLLSQRQPNHLCYVEQRARLLTVGCWPLSECTQFRHAVWRRSISWCLRWSKRWALDSVQDVLSSNRIVVSLIRRTTSPWNISLQSGAAFGWKLEFDSVRSMWRHALVEYPNMNNTYAFRWFICSRHVFGECEWH